jgi:DNA-3-methyladenine glycosylase I
MSFYHEIFNKVEETLKQQSKLSEENFNSRFGEYKSYKSRSYSDEDYYKILIEIIFYSGFRAETVDNKMDTIKKHFPDYNIVASYDDKKISEIMNDTSMIRNEKKIKACVKNARIFSDIIIEYGSFKNYLDSLKAEESFENLMLLKEEIEYKFEYIGGITAYHFMTDIGLHVLKPDRVITRIFKRLGLIENEKQLLKTVIRGRKFSQETGYPIRYIDIVFVTYGQLGKNDYFGLNSGICLEKNPYCNSCGIKEYCEYYANRK